MQKSQSQTQFPNFQQIQQQLLDSKSSLQTLLLNLLQSSPLLLPSSTPLTAPTIDSILSSLPSQSQLTSTFSFNLSMDKRNSILQYTGSSDLINSFKQGIECTKDVSVDAYYMYAMLNLMNLRKIEEQMAEGNQLQSWKVKEDQNNVRKMEPNMLRSDYRQCLKEEERLRLEREGCGVTGREFDLKKYLTDQDLMIHVILYDSHCKQKQSQFICHTNTLLTDIRDRFQCLIQRLQESHPQLHKGSFFFLNQIFYNDTRYCRPDLSSTILNCARKNDIIYHSYSMQTTRLKSLRVEIGKQYIWRHLDSCDHKFVFSEYRLFDDSIDLRDRTMYPISVFQKRINRRRCEGCKRYFAKFVSRNDKCKGGEDLYVCEECHEGIHLSVQMVGLEKTIKLPKYKDMTVWKYVHE